MNVTTSQMKISLALKQRKIYLNESIYDDLVFEFEYIINRIKSLDKKTNTKNPIEIYIDTPGGYAKCALTIISIIESMIDDGYSIITINSGSCYSAGFFIFISGNYRKSYRYSDFMYHSLSSGYYGMLQDKRDDLDCANKLQEKLDNIVIKNTNLKKETLDEFILYKKDKYYEPNDMLSIGALEEII